MSSTTQHRILEAFLTAQGEALYSRVLDSVLDLTASEIGIFAYIDEDGAAVAPSMTPELWVQCRVSEKTLRWPRESWTDNLWSRAIRDRRTWVKNEPGSVPAGHVSIENALVSPILYLDEVIGFFMLANRSGGYGVEEQAQVEEICAYVAPVLHARLQQERREAQRARAETALRESEARLRAFLNAASDIAYVKDPELRYIAVNQAAMEFLGHDEADILGLTDDDLLGEPIASSSRASDERVLRENRLVVSVEWAGQRVYEARKFPVPLGEAMGVGAMIRDITTQRQAEEALLNSQARYRRLAETTEAALWEYDVPEDRWSYVAPQISKLTGWPSTAWTDLQSWCDRVHPDDLEQVMTLSQTLALRGEPHVLEYRFRRPDGTYVWLRDSVTVELGNRGPIHLRGFMLNITARKRAEEEMARNVARFHSLLDILQRPSGSIDALLAHTLEQALVLTGSAVGYICHYDQATQRFRLHTWTDGDAAHLTSPDRAPTFELEEIGLWGDVVRRGAPLIVNDVPADEAHRNAYPGDAIRLARLLTVPIYSGREIVAVVGVGNKESDYTEVDSLQLILMLDAVWKVVDRRRAQEALADERRLLRTVIDNLPDTIYAKDREGRKTLANRADLRAMGVTSEAEVLGKTDAELFLPDVAVPLMADDAHVLETGDPVLDREERLLDVNGVARWLLTSKFPLRNEAGEIIGLVGTGRDITDRKTLQAQIETQTRRMQEIIETVPQGVLVLEMAPGTVGARVLLANPLAQQALALSALAGDERLTHLGDRPLRDLLTSPPQGLWHEAHVANRVLEIIARPLASNSALAPGEPQPAPRLRTATPPENAAPPDCWVLVINDVTQQRLVRDQLQQQERLAAVGQLAAGIAHDFNNIMAVIVLYSQMLAQNPGLVQDNAPSRHAQKQIDVIKQQAQHAAQLIQQILDFSRNSMLDRQTVDLLPQTKEQAKLLVRMLPENIKVVFLSELDRATVHADPTRIQQLVMNLAINARDAMPEGGELTIELARLHVNHHGPRPVPDMAEGDWFCLTVADTGAGIEPDVLAHIYEPFFTTKPPGQGAGLGLPQVHGIVGQHGGHIGVNTRVGEGTVFTVYLPALNGASALAAPEVLPDVPRGAGELILVVEDNDNLRRALKTMLDHWGYRVSEAANGVEALALLGQNPQSVSLVLSDVVMPEMGGSALVRELRARGWTMPVILLSGHPRSQAPTELAGYGVYAWLPKPPVLDQLAHTLAAALKRQGAQEEPTTG